MSPYLLQLLRGIVNIHGDTFGIDMHRGIKADEKYPIHLLPHCQAQAAKDYHESITKYDYLNY